MARVPAVSLAASLVLVALAVVCAPRLANAQLQQRRPAGSNGAPLEQTPPPKPKLCYLDELLSADVAAAFNATQANCTYVIGDRVAGDAILFGEAAAAAARRDSTPPVAPEMRVLARAPGQEPLFHEAGVWSPQRGQVLFTSNRLGNLSTADQSVVLTVVDLPAGQPQPQPQPQPNAARTLTPSPPIRMANGGTLVPGTGGRVALMDSQGLGDVLGTLVALNLDTGETKALGVSGGAFSSPNDVVVLPLGGGLAVALFTDPSYGFDQRFRAGTPSVGEYVWAVTLRLPPPPPTPTPLATRPSPRSGGAAGNATGDGAGDSGSSSSNNATAPWRWWPEAVGPARVVADGFVRPNGLALSPDGATLYVSDTGFKSGSGPVDAYGVDTVGSGPPVREWAARPRSIYAFDLRRAGAVPTVALSGRRLFAVASVGIPDGLRCDAAGRLWSGEGDGVAVYEPRTGRLILRVVPGNGGGGGQEQPTPTRSSGVANFALARADADAGGGGGWLVMGMEEEAVAVRLPGLNVVDPDRAGGGVKGAGR